jgi:hypothetical protein
MCSRHRCSFTGRPDVLKVINGLLAQRVSAKKIEQLSGIPYTTAGRHSQFCVIRQQAQKLRNDRFNPNSGREFVRVENYPDETGKICEPFVVPADRPMTADDILYIVTYETSSHFYNPSGLMRDGAWTAESQILFATRCSPDVRASFIDGEHEKALLENLEHDFAADPHLSDLEAQLSNSENVTPE